MPAILSLSNAAVDRIKTLVAQSADPVVGLRVTVNKGGCSGLSYDIQYAKEIKVGDEIVEQDGARVCVDPKAVLYLIGTTMDFKEEMLSSRFVFVNPNEKGKCGCGESFHV